MTEPAGTADPYISMVIVIIIVMQYEDETYTAYQMRGVFFFNAGLDGEGNSESQFEE